ncbi:hypothetical protein [Pontibacter indicus]|uniref:hypothetical protein n=1 Tax=Pontibacter indicus TaxID=1317125 RepID=UPI0011158E60|nr:hypothetical protein [Pontibacter indicus]
MKSEFRIWSGLKQKRHPCWGWRSAAFYSSVSAIHPPHDWNNRDNNNADNDYGAVQVVHWGMVACGFMVVAIVALNKKGRPGGAASVLSSVLYFQLYAHISAHDR